MIGRPRARAVLVVYAHPVEDSYAAALRDQVVAAFTGTGRSVDVLDLYAEGFDPVLSRQEKVDHRLGIAARPSIAGHAARLAAADTLVFVHPTWWGGQPAILKGWFDRVWTDGVAYHYPPGAKRLRRGLRNIRRIAVVTTHGSPRWVNVLQGEPGKHTIGRGLRLLCHPRCRFRWIALYGIDRADGAARAAFLARVDAAIRRF